MKILRLSTVALTIVLFTMGDLILPVNTALAHCKGKHARDPGMPDCLLPHGGGGEEPGDGLIYTVDLRGNADNGNPYGDQGAFEFDMALMSSPKSAILDKGGLKGTQPFTITRPGDSDANDVWNDVFNLCGLLGPYNSADPDPDDGSAPTNVDTFDVDAGDWNVAKGGGIVRLSLGFTIDAVFSGPAGNDRDLSASLQLTGPCESPGCDSPNDKLIPTMSGEIIEKNVIEASIHLRGRGGVTHRAVCHADDDFLEGVDDGMPPARDSGSTLVITAELPPT